MIPKISKERTAESKNKNREQVMKKERKQLYEIEDNNSKTVAQTIWEKLELCEINSFWRTT